MPVAALSAARAMRENSWERRSGRKKIAADPDEGRYEPIMRQASKSRAFSRLASPQETAELSEGCSSATYVHHRGKERRGRDVTVSVLPQAICVLPLAQCSEARQQSDGVMKAWPGELALYSTAVRSAAASRGRALRHEDGWDALRQ